MIELRGVSQVFRSRDREKVVALHDIALDVAENEFVCIVGPSGCGKSTLLRLVAGLIEPTRGGISVGGVPVTRPREDVGIVFQKPTLLPWASVLDNVLMPLKLMGRPTAQARPRAQELLRMVGLEGFESRLPGELSGGMQQRAAICRALIHDPPILLMDEPFGALDALTREEMTLELLEIWQRRRKTIVFVTHSITEAVLLADKVVVMSARPGRIVQVLDVDVPRPRAFEQEALPAFQRIAGTVRALIFSNRRLPRDA
ncbi:ABC transporter ATP-binding protein [Falsiroseomonas oryzae]|uniref:ABC transporter ATP-binding protein n=1 Tax=Falsiroseomonas oryzae TaxID=2766473 RepID=UPI0022EA4B57|nr:ABC transporter ATP-binding protein [Roseomonas sp. MO-31]